MIGSFDDFTLLDFILSQREKFEGEGSPSKEQESAAEGIENNIRKKIVERIVINPKRYEKLAGILEKLILERRIKHELFNVLKSKDEVERVFKIVVEQEEY